MKMVKSVAVLAVAALACFASLVLFAPPASAAGDPDPLISVEYIGVNPALESIDSGSPEFSGDIMQSLSSAKLGSDPADESAFLLRLQKNLALEFCTVSGFSAQGRPLPGESLAKYSLPEGEVYLFRHHVPEGMPNLLVCARAGAERLCWAPRFSGMDGSVELDPGFILFEKN